MAGEPSDHAILDHLGGLRRSGTCAVLPCAVLMAPRMVLCIIMYNKETMNVKSRAFFFSVFLAATLIAPYAAQADDLDPVTYQNFATQIKAIADVVASLAVKVQQFLAARTIAVLPPAPAPQAPATSPYALSAYAPPSLPGFDAFPGLSSPLGDFGLSPELLTASSVQSAMGALNRTSLFNGPPAGFNINDLNSLLNLIPQAGSAPASRATGPFPTSTEGGATPAIPQFNQTGYQSLLQQNLSELNRLLGL